MRDHFKHCAWTCHCLVFFVSLSLVADAVHAEANTDKADWEKRASRKIQMLQNQLAALTNEKSQWEKDKADLLQQLAHITANAEKLKQQSAAAADKKQQSLSQAVQKGNLQKAELEATLEDTRKKLDELGLSHKTALQTLNELDALKKTLELNLVQQASEINACERKNSQLYTFNTQLLEAYKNKSLWDILLQKEPFTQIKRVEVENIVQEYREKISDQKFEPTLGSQQVP